jgi:predicted DNA binding CopG/RHH family protein
LKKKIARFESDEQAETFVATADLTQYDLTGARAVQFEFEKKAAQINMRVPRGLLDAVKARAEARGIPYTRFIREILEKAVASQ